jgi:hypothetical protein
MIKPSKSVQKRVKIQKAHVAEIPATSPADFKFVRVRASYHNRLKVEAAMQNTNMGDIMEKLLDAHWA